MNASIEMLFTDGPIKLIKKYIWIINEPKDAH